MIVLRSDTQDVRTVLLMKMRAVSRCSPPLSGEARGGRTFDGAPVLHGQEALLHLPSPDKGEAWTCSLSPALSGGARVATLRLWESMRFPLFCQEGPGEVEPELVGPGRVGAPTDAVGLLPHLTSPCKGEERKRKGDRLFHVPSDI